MSNFDDILKDLQEEESNLNEFEIFDKKNLNQVLESCDLMMDFLNF